NRDGRHGPARVGVGDGEFAVAGGSRPGQPERTFGHVRDATAPQRPVPHPFGPNNADLRSILADASGSAASSPPRSVAGCAQLSPVGGTSDAGRPQWCRDARTGLPPPFACSGRHRPARAPKRPGPAARRTVRGPSTGDRRLPLVYRTVFTVSPPCDVVGLSLDTFSTWLAHKSDGRCPDLSRSGHHVLDHRYTVKVVRHENPAENLRFLRLKTESTHERSGTVWQTVLTAVSDPGRASDRTVWIDMTAIPPGAEAAQAPFEVVRPKLVRSFLNAARCFDGAAVLTEAPVIVRGRDTRAVDALLAAICDDSRRMAVVATVAPPDLTVVGWRMAMGQVLKSACGMYSGYVLDRAAQERVAARLPREFDIPAGGVRTFRPGVRLSDPGDHRRHPRLGMDAARTGGVIAPRIGRTLAHALREVV